MIIDERTIALAVAALVGLLILWKLQKVILFVALVGALAVGAVALVGGIPRGCEIDYARCAQVSLKNFARRTEQILASLGLSPKEDPPPSLPPPPPDEAVDLVITSVGVNRAIGRVGDRFRFGVSIMNAGRDPVPHNIEVHARPGPRGSIRGLAPGETKTLFFEFDPLRGGGAAATGTTIGVRFVVDPGNQYAETNEQNNLSPVVRVTVHR